MRISFDIPCYFVKENDHPGFWADLHQPMLQPEPFAYGILEIKLVGDTPPAWVDELIATGHLIKGPAACTHLSESSHKEEERHEESEGKNRSNRKSIRTPWERKKKPR